MTTRYYSWPELQPGARDYEQTHSELVTQIDSELHRIEGLTDDTTVPFTVARPGDVQATIDQLHTTGGGVVTLDPTTTYRSSEEGGEIHIKKQVVVNAPGVDYEIDTDTNGFFVDNEAKLFGYPDIQVTVGSGYSSAAIIFDQGRAADGIYGFGPDTRDNATARAHIENGSTSGTGVFWDSDGKGISFTRADVYVRGFSSCLKFDTAGSFINGNRISGVFTGGRNIIHQIGNGACENDIYGVIQCATGTATDRAIWNEGPTGERSITFHGQIWDTYAVEVTAIEGPEITVLTDYTMVYPLMRDSDPADNNQNSAVYGFGEGFRMGWLDSCEMWEQKVTGGGMRLSYYDAAMNETQLAHMTEAGDLNLAGTVNENQSL